jgi:hypothetical protein
MKTFRVECTGNVREVYLVEAETAEQAMANWADGVCIVQESSSVEPVSARPEDD